LEGLLVASGGEQRPGGRLGEPEQLRLGRELGEQRHHDPGDRGEHLLLARRFQGDSQHLGAGHRQALGPGRLVEQGPSDRTLERGRHGDRLDQLVLDEGEGLVDVAQHLRCQCAAGDRPLAGARAGLRLDVGHAGDLGKQPRRHPVEQAGRRLLAGEPQHRGIERRRGDGRRQVAVDPGDRLDQREVGAVLVPGLLAQQRQAERRLVGLPGDHLAEHQGLAPVGDPGIGGEAVAHLPTGGIGVAGKQQAVDPGLRHGLVEEALRHHARQPGHALAIAQLGQQRDPERRQVGVVLARRGGGVAQQQPVGEIAQGRRAQIGGQAPQQRGRGAPIGAAPHVDPEAAVVRAEHPDRLGIDRAEGADLDAAFLRQLARPLRRRGPALRHRRRLPGEQRRGRELDRLADPRRVRLGPGGRARAARHARAALGQRRAGGDQQTEARRQGVPRQARQRRERLTGAGSAHRGRPSRPG